MQEATALRAAAAAAGRHAAVMLTTVAEVRSTELTDVVDAEQAEEALCANDGTGGDVEVDSGVPYALRICFDAL